MQTQRRKTKNTIEIGSDKQFNLKIFRELVLGSKTLSISKFSEKEIISTRKFVDYLLDNNIKVYGLTTGFADLRNQMVDASRASELSVNLIHSHDAAIGPWMEEKVVLGAMCVRASSLAKGYSGIRLQTLQTLLQMINHKIIPLIPQTGSLGASGDLATLSRLGRAMMGEEVPVRYQQKEMTAKRAFSLANIHPITPEAKEGLAITNGTAFMISMLSLAYLEEIKLIETLFALIGLFLNASNAVNAAFFSCMHTVRGQTGQQLVSSILKRQLENSPFIETNGIQDDYCIRCLPQIFGPKIETILQQKIRIERELDAVTDNPLLFKDDYISEDVNEERIITYDKSRWTILSGGNFHGETITTASDELCIANAKIALTIERQITYLLNPFRNKHKLPSYLIVNPEKIGSESGYMITQYTANALTQKICHLAHPTSTFNLTSANESEDIVSYGASAAEKLLEQLARLRELAAIYTIVVAQSYGIRRSEMLKKKRKIPSQFFGEKLFQLIVDEMEINFPTTEDASFDKRYEKALKLVDSGKIPELFSNPLS